MAIVLVPRVPSPVGVVGPLLLLVLLGRGTHTHKALSAHASSCLAARGPRRRSHLVCFVLWLFLGQEFAFGVWDLAASKNTAEGYREQEKGTVKFSTMF